MRSLCVDAMTRFGMPKCLLGMHEGPQPKRTRVTRIAWGPVICDLPSFFSSFCSPHPHPPHLLHPAFTTNYLLNIHPGLTPPFQGERSGERAHTIKVGGGRRKTRGERMVCLLREEVRGRE